MYVNTNANYYYLIINLEISLYFTFFCPLKPQLKIKIAIKNMYLMWPGSILIFVQCTVMRKSYAGLLLMLYILLISGIIYIICRTIEN